MPVGGAQVTEIDLTRDRRDPDRRRAEARNLVELRGEPGEIAAVEAARVVAVDVEIVRAGTIRESVEDDEVKHRVGPVALRRHDDRRGRDSGVRRLWRVAGATSSREHGQHARHSPGHAQRPSGNRLSLSSDPLRISRADRVF
jgi:hypothetical protein